MTTVLKVLLLVISAACLGFAQVASSSDAACLGECQRELATSNLPGSSGDTELSGSEALDYQRKLCELYGNMKECFLTCEGGSEAWEEFSSGGSDQVLQMCGLTGGAGDSSSADFQDMLCAQGCQVAASEKISKAVPQGPPADSGGPASSANSEVYLEQNRQICAAEDEMKKCVIGCKGGQKIWETQFSTFVSSCSSGPDGIEAKTCAFACQQQQSDKLGQRPDASSSPNPPDVALGTICSTFEEIKSCILKCDGGENSWDEIVTNSELMGAEDKGNIIQLCGLGGSGDSTVDLPSTVDRTIDGGSSTDFVCASTCQSTFEGKATIIYSRTDTEFSEIPEKIEELCDVMNVFKDCLTTCGQTGQRLWDQAFANASTIDVGIGTLGETCFPAGEGGPLSDLYCATACQSAYEGNISSTLNRPVPESLDEIAKNTKHICDATNVVKDCFLACGKAGQQFWEKAFLNQSTVDVGVGNLAQACFPDQVPDEVLESYQCFVGTCTKCRDLPLEQCMPDFLVYPSKSACESSKCGKIGQEDNYNYCKMDDSKLGPSEINLQCNPNVPAAGCYPSYACLPLEAFGAHYCCPDSPEQAQIICMQKCKSFIRSQQSKLFSLISQPDALREAGCSIYHDEKNCMLKCPSGQQGFVDYQQTKQSSKGYRELMTTCGSGVETTLGSANTQSVKRDPATSETSPEVAEYCRRVLNQKNGDTTFCRYQNFTETCKNVCPQ